MSGDDDDGPLTLRSDTLAALSSFLAERAAAEEAASREAEDAGATLLTTEDWELSQFWYDESTSRFLAAEVMRNAVDAGASGGSQPIVVAFVSSPSAYKAFRALPSEPGVRGVLLEYDARFAVFGSDFVQFDYRRPAELPAWLLGGVDVFLLDPPFLNPDCLRGFSEAVAAMKRAGGAATRIMLASGAVMLRPARDLMDLRPTRVQIHHAAGRLSNPFALFANYERPEHLGGWDEEAENAQVSL